MRTNLRDQRTVRAIHAEKRAELLAKKENKTIHLISIHNSDRDFDFKVTTYSFSRVNSF
jgi:hypothetical protein